MNKHKHNILNKITNKPLSTPELNHHSIHGRRSRPLGRALPTSQRRWFSSSRKPAFTIIEVVLVLAIAGLIFLMVFIALPALQRSQRDAQRRQDLARLKTAIDNYKSNNRGQIPNMGLYGSKLLPTYLRNGGEQFNDPSGTAYAMTSHGTGPDGKPTSPVGYSYAGSDIHMIYVSANRKCAENGSFADNPGKNNYAIQMRLEGRGVYCLDG